MRLSSRLFLLSADDTLYALANAAFMRMLRREAVARIPDFAGQRVRQASVDVEVVNGTPSRTVHCTFAILDIDGDGVLDVERFTSQQFARVDDPFAPEQPARGTTRPIVDAASRFLARGGSWEPDQPLLRRIDAAALGQLACPRVRVVR
jgi:hypothetical protein